MHDDAITLPADAVEALARVSATYTAGLLHERDMVEQGDGDFDLDITVLPTVGNVAENRMTRRREPAHITDIRLVIETARKLGASLIFRSTAGAEKFTRASSVACTPWQAPGFAARAEL